MQIGDHAKIGSSEIVLAIKDPAGQFGILTSSRQHEVIAAGVVQNAVVPAIISFVICRMDIASRFQSAQSTHYSSRRQAGQVGNRLDGFVYKAVLVAAAVEREQQHSGAW